MATFSHILQNLKRQGICISFLFNLSLHVDTQHKCTEQDLNLEFCYCYSLGTYRLIYQIFSSFYYAKRLLWPSLLMNKANNLRLQVFLQQLLYFSNPVRITKWYQLIQINNKMTSRSLAAFEIWLIDWLSLALLALLAANSLQPHRLYANSWISIETEIWKDQ